MRLTWQLRGDREVEDAFERLYALEGFAVEGFVAVVAPGTYAVEGRAGEKTVRAEVAAEATKVAEIWLSAERVK